MVGPGAILAYVPARPNRRIGRRRPSLGGPSSGSGRVLLRETASLRWCCFPVRLLSRKPARDSQKVGQVVRYHCFQDRRRGRGRGREIQPVKANNVVYVQVDEDDDVRFRRREAKLSSYRTPKPRTSLSIRL